MKKLFAALLLCALPMMLLAQPAPILRNPFTTNALPQVNRGFGITIQTNVGHKLVINVDGGALTNQLYWTNIAGLLRTIGSGVYTNFVVDTNVASLRIGSIAWIDPTNENAFYGAGSGSNNIGTITFSAGFGSDTFGANSGLIDDGVAFGWGAGVRNSGTIDNTVLVGEGAGFENSGEINLSVGVGRNAFVTHSGIIRNVVGVGDSMLSGALSGTNWVMVGGSPSGPIGRDIGSFGFNNTFTVIGAVSNRWIFGAGATNTLANSMVFGSGTTNYNFRNVEYTFPADNGTNATFLVNNGAGTLSWSNNIQQFREKAASLTITNIDVRLGNLFVRTNTANTVYVFSNAVMPTGIVQVVNLVLSNAGSFTATFTNTNGPVRWPDSIHPVTTASKIDVFTFLLVGSNVFGNVITNFAAPALQ